jgi:HPt (histidine-containing phosphotransfer) domain-containing protein
MNNEKLYTRLLVKFRDTQGQFADMFAAALTDADTTAPARAAHTLRGTAGNVGAKGVQTAAAELELACVANADRTQIDALLAETLAQLSTVVNGLKTLGDAPAQASQASSAVDPAKIKAALKALTALLKDSDSTASEAVEKLQVLAQGTPLAGVLEDVAQAVADYDFDTALEHLAKA